MYAKGPQRHHHHWVKIESKSGVSDNADGARAKIQQGPLAGSKVSPLSLSKTERIGGGPEHRHHRPLKRLESYALGQNREQSIVSDNADGMQAKI
jgi:hypothetical protein